MKLRNRILAMLLALLMVASSLPVAVFAEGDGVEMPPVSVGPGGDGSTETEGSLTIEQGSSVTVGQGTIVSLNAFWSDGNASEQLTVESENPDCIAPSFQYYLGTGEYEIGLKALEPGSYTVTLKTSTGLSASVRINVEDVSEIALGEVIKGHMQENDFDNRPYRFVAPESGYYGFFINCPDYYLGGSLVKGAYYSFRNYGHLVKMQVYLEEGEECFVRAGHSGKAPSLEAPPEYAITAKSLPSAETLSFVDGETAEVTVNTQPTIFWTEFGPGDVYDEDVRWSVSDPTVLEVISGNHGGDGNRGAEIRFLKVGEAVLYAESVNGLKAQITITVKDTPVMPLDEVICVTEETLFRFVPDESGFYELYSFGCVNCDPYVDILDENMNRIARDDDSAGDLEFSVEQYLEAGKTYCLRFNSWGWDSQSAYYNALMKKIADAETVRFVEDEITVSEGNYVALDMIVTPEGSVLNGHEFIFTDPSVLTYNCNYDTEDGNPGISFLAVKAGETDVTVRLQNGVEDTVKVIVKALEMVSLDEEVSVTARRSSKDEKVFGFVAPETGRYVLNVSSSADMSASFSGSNDYQGSSAMQMRIAVSLSEGERGKLKFTPWGENEEEIFTYTFKVEKAIAAESISFVDGSELTLSEGSDQKFLLTALPEQALLDWVDFYVSDPEIVQISTSTMDPMGRRGVILYGVKAGTVTLTAVMGELTATATVTVKGPDPILLGETKIITAPTLFTFTPEESGVYRFYSFNRGSLDPHATLYDKDGGLYVSNDDFGNGWNFRIQQALVAGKTYYLQCNMWSSNNPGSYSVTVEKLPVSETFSFEEIATVYEGMTAHIEIDPEDGYVFGELDAVFSDPELALLTDRYETSNGGIVFSFRFLKAGEASFTVTLASGYSASLNVSVLPAESILLGEEKSVTVKISEKSKAPFRFEAEEDGIYQFTILSPDFDVMSTLLFGENEHGSSGYGIRFQAPLSAGDKALLSTVFSEEREEEFTYTVKVEKTVPATGLVLGNGERIEGEVGEYIEIYPNLSPDNAICENVSRWTVSDEKIAYVDSYTSDTMLHDGIFLYCVSEGTVTLTATTENGLFASVEVVVKKPETINLGEEKTGKLKEYKEKRYIFKPEESGIYGITFKGKNAYQVELYTTDGDYVNYISIRNGVRYARLTAGEEYLLLLYGEGEYSLSVNRELAAVNMEILTEPDVMTYVKGCVDEAWDMEGLSIRLTMEDGSTVDWEYGDETAIGANYLHYWLDGEEGTVNFECNGIELVLTYELIDSPVRSIEVLPMERLPYVIENFHGYFDTTTDDEGNEVEYFHYYMPDLSGVRIRITYVDGTEKTVNMFEKVDGYFLSYDSEEQWKEPFEVGTDNVIYVKYQNETAPLNIEVVENPIASLELVSADVPTLLENTYGYYDWYYDEELDDSVEFFKYSWPVPESCTVKVIYKDGTEKTVDIEEDLDGYSFVWDDDQDKMPWEKDKENSLILSYMGVKVRVPIRIVENPVDHIEIVTAPTREYIYGDVAYGNLFADGEYDLHPWDLNGIEFIVHFKDGTQKRYTFEDLDVDNFICDGYDFDVWCNPAIKPETRELPAFFHYMGHRAEYTVKIKESPLASLEVLDPPYKSEYDEDHLPILDGLRVKLTFTDGTEKTVLFEQGNHEFCFGEYGESSYWEIVLEGVALQVRYESYPEEYFYVSALGKIARIPALTLDGESKKVDALENISLSASSVEGSILVTYKDSSSETVVFSDSTIIWLYPKEYMEEDYKFAYVKTAEGYVYFEITEGDSEGIYTLYLGGKRTRIPAGEIAPDYVIGDVNGNGDVSSEDAVYLLYHTLFGNERYPIEQGCDFNGDGDVGSADAIYLLYHVLFGDTRYPLS